MKTSSTNMELYIYMVENLLQANGNRYYSYYDSIILVAESEAMAKTIMPNGARTNNPLRTRMPEDEWTENPEELKVTLLGVANIGFNNGQIILCDFQSNEY